MELKSLSVDKPDAIVIGAGLNGLVAAACLAKAGKAVVVIAHSGKETLDYSDAISGTDGFPYATLGGDRVSLPQEIVWHLGLEALGVRFASNRSTATITSNGAIVRDADPIAMDRRLRAHAPREADAYRNYRSLIIRQRRLFDRYLEKGAGRHPKRRAFLDILRDASQDGMLEAAHLYTKSLRDVLDRNFENDLLKTSVMASALEGPFGGMGLGPFSPTSASALLHDPLTLADYQSPTQSRRVVGAKHRLIVVLKEFIKAAGGTIVEEAPVSEITRKKDAVTGVALEGGQFIEAGTIICDIDVKRVAFSLLNWKELPQDLAYGIANLRSRAQSVQINLALSEMPVVPDLYPGFLESGTLHIIDGMIATERAFDDWKAGKLPTKPPLQFEVQGTSNGKVYASVFAHFIPGNIVGGEWDDKTKVQVIGGAVKALAEVSPGFEKLLLDARLISPVDAEKRFGLIGGHPFGGETAYDQILPNRPNPTLASGVKLLNGLHLLGLTTSLSPFLDGAPGSDLADNLAQSPLERIMP